MWQSFPISLKHTEGNHNQEGGSKSPTDLCLPWSHGDSAGAARNRFAFRTHRIMNSFVVWQASDSHCFNEKSNKRIEFEIFAQCNDHIVLTRFLCREYGRYWRKARNTNTIQQDILHIWCNKWWYFFRRMVFKLGPLGILPQGWEKPVASVSCSKSIKTVSDFTAGVIFL